MWLAGDRRSTYTVAIRYDTIRDAILTCSQKPTRVSLIYRAEPATKKWKTEKNKKWKTGILRSVNRLRSENKVVTDRRLCPRCCHLQSYFERPKSSPVHPLACSWYYCVQLITKPKAACALCFSWAATSRNLGLRANMTSSVKPEVHNISQRRQRRTEPRL